MKKMRCGACGESKHEILKLEKRDGLIVRCTQCNNESEIAISKPKIEIKWVADHKGILAVF